MTLAAILVFAAGTYLLRLSGLLLHDRIEVSDRTRSWLALPAVALLAALAATSALLPSGVFDSPARMLGVGVGVAAALRRLPFVLIVVLAAGVTAALRQAGMP